MTDFKSLLSQPVHEVERPKPIPAGSYVFTVADFTFGEARNEKKTPSVEFKLVPSQAMEDVDPDELSAALGDKTLTDISMRNTIYVTADSVWRLDEFLVEKLGIEKGLERSVMIEQTKGRQVVGMVVHNPSKDGTTVYANIAQFAPYEG